MTDVRLHCWLIAIAVTLMEGILIPLAGNAQIIPDDTLGQERSRITPDLPNRDHSVDRVDGGALRGSSLFHSFLEFNVNEGQRVYFANPAGVETIFSRVTGNYRSDISGTLGVDGTATLFLLNPHGIFFGPNAQLDIRGSFIASTAQGFTFPDGSEFSAIHPQAAPLLSINVPPGMQWGEQDNGTIANQATLAAGQDLTLMAGILDLQGQLGSGRDLTLQALTLLQIRDQPTSPFIAAAGRTLLLQGNQTIDIFALNSPQSGLFSGGDMVLRSPTPVLGDAHYWSAGNFRIEQLDGIPGDLVSPGDPIIRSNGDVQFDTYVGSSLHILAGGNVNINLIGITGADTGTNGTDFLVETVSLSNGNSITIDGGTRPTLDIRAGVSRDGIATAGVTGASGFPSEFFASGFTTLFGVPFPTLEPPTLTSTPSGATINLGGVAFLGANAADGLVLISNQYRPNPTLTGDINVGLIVTTDDVDAISGTTNTDQFSNPLPQNIRDLLAIANLDTDFTGNGGDVILDARRDIVLNGSGLEDFGLNFSAIVTSSSTGQAGEITLLADNKISITNQSLILSDTGSAGGGDIDIRARSFLLGGGSLLVSQARSTGSGGNITITTEDQTELADSGTFVATTTLSEQPGGGRAGNLTINTQRLLIRDGAFASTSSELRSVGETGDLIVNATESVRIIRGLGLSANTNGLGNAGDLTVLTPNLLIDQDTSIQGSGISASSRPVNAPGGQGGNIRIEIPENVPGRIEILGNRAGAVNFNSIKDTADQLANLVLEGVNNFPTISGIIAASAGEGAAGNLTLDLGGNGSLIVRNGAGVGTVTARSTGNAGDLQISGARFIELTGLGGLSSGTFGDGDAGMITVEAQQILVQDGALISADTFGGGMAGDVRITSDRLTVQGGSQIRAGTTGSGKGGNVQVVANTIDLIGSSPNNQVASGISTASTESTGSGDSGAIVIRANQITIQEGAEISTFTANAGSGGDLQVRANSLVLSDHAQISAATSGAGAGGDINLRVLGTLQVINSEISASASSNGAAGNLQIVASTVRLNQGTLTAQTKTGNGGNITLRGLQLLTMQNNSLISANALDNANGGNITLDMRGGSVLTTPAANSDIVANADRGNGGKINVIVQGLFGTQFRNERTPESDITASSEFGLDGDVRITTPDVDPRQGLVELPDAPVDASRLVTQRCLGASIADGGTQGEFIVTGRGGLPAVPQEVLSQDGGWRDWRDPIANSTLDASMSPASAPSTHPQLTEASQWRINHQGQVVLTANPTAIASLPSPTCTSNRSEAR